ncbi:SGS-domain-containing protein [Trematosphaeria pertusa]|uniref:SGS-domain-containing protein n=1 Tax=Trematosphaeria pertusa TaxID=390896 RepID=A0A6A6I9L6_9PLEO|nr:SGS-domain-containing protein [Trematosphaeria pertusa]KAF2246210.1 SGS-domain-containing protein [Trematosphaeria pertusa]
MDQAARGAAALSASKYDEAIKHYTDAIATNPQAVDYYIKRSTAYQRSTKYPEALADAETAVALAHKRARRELIKEAQLRRGIALYFVEQYANAEYILAIVKKLNEKEKTLAIWNMKVAAKLKGIPEDDERRKVTAKEWPEVEVPSAPSAPKPAKSEEKGKAKVEAAPVAPKPVVPTPANKIKHDWYQNNENVTLTLLAKGVPKDKATVDIDKDSLSISFPIEGSSSDFNYTLDPFYAEVDPAQSSFRITPTKVEVTLKKATPGVKWHALESDRKTETPTEEKATIPSHVLTGKTNEATPAYPTSSKKGVKNWDQITKEDLAEEDDFEGDETTRFFKQLYKGAAPEQQRAMMKSYQESGGTVLSTDWSSVGNKYVKPEPPEGMEAKKYSG